ncbi:MAG: N-6 DNA methylase [Clostridiales bacterium]|nr:N-6 DNA methylase [Clostridiales bacterium]
MDAEDFLNKRIDKIYDDYGEKDAADVISISKRYESMIDEEKRKNSGCYYTDESIIGYMIDIVFDKIDMIDNPFLRILDPSCGCGFFLLQIYDYMRDFYLKNINGINSEYKRLNLSADNIHEHIIKNNIFGADSDKTAVNLSCAGLMLKKNKSAIRPNIICCDSLIDHNMEDKLFKGKYDIIIGNPPYIGHKRICRSYREKLSDIYKGIFRDKADISFCFIKSSIDRLKGGGRLCFITSRYFLESLNGKYIRDYIDKMCSIERIVDFYGVRIMEGISVDPVILLLRKNKSDNDPAGNSNIIKVFKAKNELRRIGANEAFVELRKGSERYFDSFNFPQRKLNHEGWILCDENQMQILEKINRKLGKKLSDICKSFQGIITGCDKAFIMDEKDIENYKIERDLIKPWIKSSCIKKYKAESMNLYIIYSDIIDDADSYKNAISYIERYRPKLEKRRECISGARKWYELQWGRNRSLFEMNKIIFPYKASSNRFAIDKGNYSSADVYGLYIIDEYKDKISYEFLTGILNSRLYEFYFKSFAKKLGNDLYEYYPNTVMRLKVPEIDDGYIADLVRHISTCRSEEVSKGIQKEIDRYIYSMFDINESEINIIEGRDGR